MKMKNSEIFLQNTKYLNWKNPVIQQTIDLIFENGILENEIDKAITIFNFVRDHIQYKIPDHFLRGKYIVSSSLLEIGAGNCLQKSLILASLGRACGIPTRLHIADIINHAAPPNYVKEWGNIMYWHGYVDIYLEDKWVAANPDYPASLCEKKGYPIVQFDGKHDACLPTQDNEGNKFIEYIADHGWYADLPKLRMQWNYFKAYFWGFLKNKVKR